MTVTKIRNITAEEVCSVFNPFSRNYMTLHFDTSYESIAEDIETGVLTLTVESVEIKELNLPPRRGGETKRHRLLKGNAGKMLKELGEAHVIVERARHEWSLKTSLKVS